MIYLLMLYGDFGMLYVESVWQSTHITPIPDFGDDREGEEAKKWLKENGFKLVKYRTIECGGNY
jgi:hypothetical protein